MNIEIKANPRATTPPSMISYIRTTSEEGRPRPTKDDMSSTKSTNAPENSAIIRSQGEICTSSMAPFK
jgi:hypothetical protein